MDSLYFWDIWNKCFVYAKKLDHLLFYVHQSVLCRMIAWTISFLSSRLYNMNVFHSTWSCLNYKIFACSHFCGLIISIQQMNTFSKGLLIFNSRINDLSTLGEKQICRGNHTTKLPSSIILLYPLTQWEHHEKQDEDHQGYILC